MEILKIAADWDMIQIGTRLDGQSGLHYFNTTVLFIVILT